MKIGFIGLGRMGENMVYNLLESKQKVVAYNRSPAPVRKVAKKGAIPAFTIEELCAKLGKRKVIWIMIKSGKPVDMVIKSLTPYLNRGDVVIDGGNSFYKDSLRRGKALKKKGIHFFDVGVSGGMEGARKGGCMMAGGDKKGYKKYVEPLLKKMCAEKAYGRMGEAGAGHFVKMVHNGVEYGMMAAVAEGMQALKKHERKFGIDLHAAAQVYAHRSIIDSRIVKWMLEAMEDGTVRAVKGSVPHGETEDEMKHLEKLAEMKVLKTARLMRKRTREKPSYAGKIMASIRNKFGGHAVIKKK